MMKEFDVNYFVEQAVQEASDEFLMEFLNVSEHELYEMIQNQTLIDHLYDTISKMPPTVFHDYVLRVTKE